MKNLLVAPMLALLVGLGGGMLVGPQLTSNEYKTGTAILVGSSEFPIAAGMSSFEGGPDGIIFKVLVQNVLAGNPIPLDAFIDGSKVGSFPLEKMVPVPGTFTDAFLGRGQLDLRLPAGASFPIVRDGSLVEVKTAAGRLTVSGNLD